MSSSTIAFEKTSPDESDRLHQMEQQLEHLQQQIDRLQKAAPDSNQLNIVLFEGYRDRLLAAFVIATGAAACGMEVRMFFTFWSTPALRRERVKVGKKTLVERAFGWMLPASPQKTKLSQMDMGGIGRVLMNREMRKKNIADLDTMIQSAGDLGVRIQVCEMTMNLMGIDRAELIEYPHLEFCGVATFVEQASRANTTLFI